MGEDIEGGHVGWVGTLRGSCGGGEDVLGGYPGKFPKVLSFMKVRPRKKIFVSPTTFLRVEMCHQDSVIRDMKLDQKRA